MLFYNDVAAAQEWLCTAFGFEATAVHRDPDGAVLGVEIDTGGGRVMLLGGSDEAALGMRSPSALGAMTGGVYVTLADVDTHHDRAVQAGATIAMPIQTMPYGSREYGVLDCEGHYWSFGSYTLV
ncbi:hypothetical protein AXK60_02170 [Tsukamurella pseudospumae]|uniref:VOC domain-containing protein n=2 Tax=Tsukamurella pseudospumae TaxID=239498 RepID=A0A138AWA8_9ACTN|nr:hypothetical protein AXK61_05855 [Tsukamurella pseudospumae]KXP14713.1 hypothetical protein AXK60_02170 [Tsukamurella pseudospumae]